MLQSIKFNECLITRVKTRTYYLKISRANKYIYIRRMDSLFYVNGTWLKRAAMSLNHGP
jgi:hypothetical protein